MQSQQPLSLRHNFSWTFIGNGVYAASQWGMLVVMAKLGNPEMIGQFTLGLAITAPIILFTNLQLGAVQATDAQGRYCFHDYLGLRLLSSGIALLIIAAIIWGSGYQGETAIVIGLVGIAKTIEAMSDIFYGLFQQHERMDCVSMSLMLRGITALLLLGFAVYGSGSVVWGVVGIILAWAGVLITHDMAKGIRILTLSSTPSAQKAAQKARFHFPQNLTPRFDFKTLSRLIRLALPLGLVMMLLSLNSNIPRYLIEKYWDTHALGIFAALSYLMVVGNMVISALGQSASPRLAKYYAARNFHAFRTLLLKLMGIGAVLGSVGVIISRVAGKEILEILYQPEYAQHTDLFIWLMVAAGISYIASFLGYGMTAARNFNIQIPLFLTVTIASALACFWLIPSLGLQGAAVALIVSAVVQLILSLGTILYILNKSGDYAASN